ncbi:MAG: phosphate ABC transporter permease [Gammaproteobacteria bacterium]|nr:MAG: phosphate ABC transporter permease [Gammaproteobacteria bacterium]
MYLLYVIKPIFESATVEPVAITPVSNTYKTAKQILSTGVDELKEIIYQIDQAGNFNFYSTKNKTANKLLLSQQLIGKNKNLIKVIDVQSDSANKNKILIDNQGQVTVVAANFNSTFVGDERTVNPSVVYPLGESVLPLDDQEQSIVTAGMAMDDERAIFISFTQDHRLIKTTLTAEDDFSEDSEFEASYQEIEFTQKDVENILISPDLMIAFVQSGKDIFVYELDDEENVPLKERFTPVNTKDNITAVALLSGGSSLLIGNDKGVVSQWFEVNTKQGRVFKEIRTFNASSTEIISQIYTEQFRKSFITLTPAGEMSLFYTTSEAMLWKGSLNSADAQITSLAIAPRADGIVVSELTKEGKQSLTLYDVHNEHPEVTWHALWQEVWYEGYPEPAYVWQSTSGTDDFEGKFSLVPIAFGTVKAALYAMIFALPIALFSAVYTAYFMTPALRKKVKPTIEMMEALPTVILGFLAGLWLAPLVEKYLPALFLMMIFLPLATFLTAFAWYKLPKNLKVKLPEHLAPIILIPILIFAGYLAIWLSPLIENAFFGGDMRSFISNDLGINFDQRNALVVGIAMGFAVIPTIFSMAEDAIFSVPSHLTSGSLALGATPWQTLTKVVLLTASPGIFSAIMMGLGRAVGETMIVLMATGNTPIMDWNIFEGMRTLAANIAVEMPESEVGSSHYRILFLAAFVLFIFTFIFNTVAEFVRQRLRDKYSSM